MASNHTTAIIALTALGSFVAGYGTRLLIQKATSSAKCKKTVDLSEIKKALVHYDDFPTKGVKFTDIHPIMINDTLRNTVIQHLKERYINSGITAVVAMESRGYYFGLPLAVELGVAFVPLRKPKKLPGEVTGLDYGTEYSKDRLEVQNGRLNASDKVVIIDDLLATGGTAAAAAGLVIMCGAKIEEISFLVELDFLGGVRKLPQGIKHYSMIHLE